MATNDHKINLEDNSKYRVAYDLMKDVAFAEGKNPRGEDARKYYFQLFFQSYKIVNGWDYSEAMKQTNQSNEGDVNRTSSSFTW